MSRIIFDSKDKRAEVYGSERFYMAHVCSEFMKMSMDVSDSFDNELKDHWTRKVIPKDSYLHTMRDYANSFNTWVSVGNENFEYKGESYSVFHMTLNTALTMGSYPVKLFAFIHGQCEIHGYIIDENKEFVASVIEEGLDIGLYRKNQGWEGVIKLLQESTGPVVMSYSVCDVFPEEFRTFNEEEDDYDYDEPIDEVWDRAIVEIMDSPCILSISKEAMDSVLYSHMFTGYSFKNMVMENLRKEKENGTQN